MDFHNDSYSKELKNAALMNGLLYKLRIAVLSRIMPVISQIVLEPCPKIFPSNEPQMHRLYLPVWLNLFGTVWPVFGVGLL
jgi:hypothetical protein